VQRPEQVPEEGQIEKEMVDGHGTPTRLARSGPPSVGEASRDSRSAPPPESSRDARHITPTRRHSRHQRK
jgi:hypothetical protein